MWGMRTPTWIPVVALLALAGGCSSPEPVRAGPPVTQALEAYQLGSAPNVHIQGGVLLAGQPSSEDFGAAKALGIRTVVDLRTPGELTEFDEPARVGELGMTYTNLGFRSPDQLTDAIFDGVRAALADEAAQPVLIHCHSANRVGAVWLAHRVLDDGVELEAAVEEAHAVGLRSAPLEERAKAYIDAHR